MSKEIVQYRQTDDWVPVMPDIVKLAGHISGTEFVPRGLRNKAPAVAAAILTGREIGLPPMTAMAHIDIIDGMPTVDPELMRALVYREGHELNYIEMTKTRCIVEGRRKGQSEFTRVTFTIDEAREMGLAQKENWRKQPQNMLVARATSRICRLLFPDVVGGLSYTPDEVMGEVTQPTDESASEVTEKQPAKLKRATKPLNAPAKQEQAEVEVVDVVVVEDSPSLPYEEADEAESTDETVSEEAAEEFVPDPVSESQLKKIAVMFRELGIDDRDDRLAYVQGIVQREIESSKELTKREAMAVIDAQEMRLAEIRATQEQ